MVREALSSFSSFSSFDAPDDDEKKNTLIHSLCRSNPTPHDIMVDIHASVSDAHRMTGNQDMS